MVDGGRNTITSVREGIEGVPSHPTHKPVSQPCCPLLKIEERIPFLRLVLLPTTGLVENGNWTSPLRNISIEYRKVHVSKANYPRREQSIQFAK